MSDILPTNPGLAINDVFYRYTVDKNIEDSFSVTIRNKNSFNDEYIFESTDDWSNIPGNTLNKIVPVDPLNRQYWGDGEILLNGEGKISDPEVRYSYTIDECYDPLFSPSCPGYENALYDWLKNNGLLGTEAEAYDPYNTKEVQDVLDEKFDDSEENDLEQASDSLSIEDKRRNLSSSSSFITDQNLVFDSLASLTNLSTYYTLFVPGGEYNDTITLTDKILPDNKRAFSTLSQDKKFNELVRSQYK